MEKICHKTRQDGDKILGWKEAGGGGMEDRKTRARGGVGKEALRGLEAHVFFYLSRQEKPTKYRRAGLSHKRRQTREVKMLLTVLVISSGTVALSGIGLLDKDSDT